MKLLSTIYRSPIPKTTGKIYLREAVRGIIRREDKLLMIHSTVNGDHKFPGGGIKKGESHPSALSREIKEECGAEMLELKRELGKTIEYAPSIQKKYHIFKQISYYYFCDVKNELGAQALEDYEKELGFHPVWIEVETALNLNKTCLANASPPSWLQREIFVLQYLLQHPLP